MIRVKLTLLTQLTLLHTNPSHQDEPFQSKTLQIKKNSSHTKLQINVIHIFADSQIGRRNQLEDAHRYVLCVQRCLQSTDLQIYRTG